MALEMEVTPDVRSAIEELYGSYRNELDAMNERIVNLVRKEEPNDQVDQVDRMSSFLQGNFMSAWGRGGQDDGDDPVRDAYEKRNDLDETYYERLVALLTPEQVEQLPRSSRRDRGGRGGDRGGERGGWGGGDFNMDNMPEQVRERLIERYDTDGDGDLSEAEIEQMREQWRGGGGPGGGGRGDRGGRGGRGGQGGGPPV